MTPPPRYPRPWLCIGTALAVGQAIYWPIVLTLPGIAWSLVAIGLQVLVGMRACRYVLRWQSARWHREMEEWMANDIAQLVPVLAQMMEARRDPERQQNAGLN